MERDIKLMIKIMSYKLNLLHIETSDKALDQVIESLRADLVLLKEIMIKRNIYDVLDYIDTVNPGLAGDLSSLLI